MTLTARTIVGIRTNAFSMTVLFLTEVLNLEIVQFDKAKEFARFKLPEGQTVEVFGTKNLWQPFTTPPDWELTVADIRFTKKRR